MKVVLASKNQHKLVEISAILSKLDIELVLEADLGVEILTWKKPARLLKKILF